ncbi:MULTISPECIES: hypothetical protein [unclassified Mesorhizobium]|jgi:outer membrane immunogenic protein|uniref:outer membrane protein n=1 Tax=unclassified Mesorhizobium TaxID=325217 RepID=UPI00095D3017|nr:MULTISPECIES: hypothetical protein [unclassified Mesorhizobium]MBN9258599.1 porin family protein [Mesorhizobium sp.]OJX79081.1 MAG: hypothetical protein BGO93_12120 [Mesorhizobium sp. 65-26]
MKSAFLAAAMLLAASSGAAFAADVALKASPEGTAPAHGWNGFYVGGNVGYGWGGNTDVAGNGTISGPLGATISTAFADSQRQQPLIGGAQIGYNYQISPQVVLGLEADIQGSGGDNSFSTPFSGIGCNRFECYSLSGTATTSDARIEWFGTVRGRVGVLINPDLLLFGTGGLAYGSVNSGNVTINAYDPHFAASFGPSTSSFGQRTKIGFAVGAGLEGRFSEWLPANWTWKLEYMYVDLGSRDSSTAFDASSSNPGNLTDLIGTVSAHTHFSDNIVRVGLNYHFN